MNRNKNDNKGLNPAKANKYRTTSAKFQRAASYNYSDMDNELSEAKSEFSKNLAKLRTEKGISAREMSLSLGQSASYISDIESGKSFPSMGMFFEICEYLKITPFEFFSYTESNKPGCEHVMNSVGTLLSKEDQALLLLIAKRMLKGD